MGFWQKLLGIEPSIDNSEKRQGGGAAKMALRQRSTRRENRDVRTASPVPLPKSKAGGSGSHRKLGRVLGGRNIETAKTKSRKVRTGRQTTDTVDMSWAATTLIAPRVQNHEWSLKDLDIYLLETKSPESVLEDLVDISPEVGRALWDFLRMVNPGWVYKVFHIGTENEYPEAKKIVAEFLTRLEDKHGSFDVVLNRMFIGSWLRGAFFAEIVLDKKGRVPVDIVTPDPATVRFKAVEDKDLGRSWMLTQDDLKGDVIELNYPTVRYIPIDPLPGQPYGRPMCSPAVFTSLFLLGLLYDLRRVIAQQGYPRMDLVVKVKDIFDGLPPDIAEEIEADFDTYTEWLESVTHQVENAYSSLEPDDAYIHSDSIVVNRPIGIDSSSLSAVGGLIAALERMCVRALKTMPLLMGIDGGGGEGPANRQWEIHVAGIKALQHLAESLIEYLFEQGLRAGGIQAKITWRFSELRVAELLRDEQVMQIRLKNAQTAYELGYMSHEQASLHAVGHTPATPKPRGEMQQEIMMAMQGIPSPDQVMGAPPKPTSPPKQNIQPMQPGGTGGPVEAPQDAPPPPSIEMGIE